MDDWCIAPKFCIIEASVEKKFYLQRKNSQNISDMSYFKTLQLTA